MATVTVESAKERLEHYRRMSLAGVCDDAQMPDDGMATLRRVFRDGTETRETLSRWLAEWTLAAIPENEPMVARASLMRGE